VTQKNGTERAFRNEYWNNHEPGIYVDVVSGEPSSPLSTKFDSGSGLASFTRPLEKAYVNERTDASLGMVRSEVRSKHGDSHLGHVFDDGPKPPASATASTRPRSASSPASRLEAEGYGEYRKLFEKASSGK